MLALRASSSPRLRGRTREEEGRLVGEEEEEGQLATVIFFFRPQAVFHLLVAASFAPIAFCCARTTLIVQCFDQHDPPLHHDTFCQGQWPSAAPPASFSSSRHPLPRPCCATTTMPSKTPNPPHRGLDREGFTKAAFSERLESRKTIFSSEYPSRGLRTEQETDKGRDPRQVAERGPVAENHGHFHGAQGAGYT